MENNKNRFLKGVQLTRSEIWSSFHADEGEKPKGGNWDTGYVTEGDELVAFLNIDAAGRTGHDFANYFDPDSEEIIWFGKPRSHSKQPLFQRLLSGDLTPHFFARWNSKNTMFTYLGLGKVLSFEDEFPIGEDKTAIRLRISVSNKTETVGSDGVIDTNSEEVPSFAKRVRMIVNRYERDPNKRTLCLEHYGYSCQICYFSFQDAYGELGKDFCHVHHIEPLGEVGGELNIDPIKDLIPVCPNCHAMIHRQTPALKPDDLRSLLRQAQK
jgi:hypothetical protein